jgi:hypothetical protein
LGIRQTLGDTVAHTGYQRMRGAQVYAYGDAPGVRVGRLPGFGNLQHSHVREIFLVVV